MLLKRSTRPGEQGFILITAIWLLLLAGSIAALLVLQSLATATRASDRQRAVEEKLALDAAFETVFADRLINGVSSQWWLVPAEGSVMIGDIQVSVRLTSESGRIDINEADPALIQSALQGLGLKAAARERFVGRLVSLRARKIQISSFDHLRQIEMEAVGQASCLESHFTFASGLAEPRHSQMSERLSQALGYGGAGAHPEPLEAGAAIRLAAQTAEGRSMQGIARFAGSEQPLAISNWGSNAGCAGIRI